jgi:hypothetical protein
MASQVLKAENSAVDSSYVTKEFAADHDEVWITIDVGFFQEALDVWTADPTGVATFSGNFVEIETGSAGSYASSEGLSIDGGGPGPEYALLSGRGGAEGTSVLPTPTANVFVTQELHWKRNDVAEVYIGGALEISGASLDEAFGVLLIGQRGEAPLDAAAIAYIDNVKVGTVRGGSDLFSDDFEDGTLGAWDATSGDVSVVDNPGIGSAQDPANLFAGGISDRGGNEPLIQTAQS